MGKIRDIVRYWLGIGDVAATPDKPAMRINPATVAEMSVAGRPPVIPWKLPAIPPFVSPQAKMAMDYAPVGGPGGAGGLYQWMTQGAFSEGLGFLGYPYLAELTQRTEYRRISEIFAAEATRKGIKFKGDDDRIDRIEKRMEELAFWPVIREVIEHDGFFGRGQIFTDLGDDDSTEAGQAELAKPLVAKAKMGKGKLEGFRTVEPFWSYPGFYNSSSPLSPDFYKPQQWFVMSTVVHESRLLTVIGRQLPDMLKPAYMFGGLSMSQMVKPYVDNWLRTRQSVSDLLHSFSTMVLKTNMGAILSGGSAENFLNRLKIYTQGRDNRGILAVDMENEDLTNVSTPLGTLDKLLAQSQEQIASACGIPLVILLGVTPSGLNASSDGEVRSHYANVKSYQERVIREPATRMIEYIQLDLFGDIDPKITFEFTDLYEMDEKDKAAIRKSDADMDVAYVGAAIVSNEEVRKRIVEDEDSPYYGVELSDELPEPPDPMGGAGDDPEGGGPGQAADAWEEGKHPRAENGQFGSGAVHSGTTAFHGSNETFNKEDIKPSANGVYGPGYYLYANQKDASAYGKTHKFSVSGRFAGDKDFSIAIAQARAEGATRADKQVQAARILKEAGFDGIKDGEIFVTFERPEVGQAADAWEEGEHPRAENGQFGSGGNGGSKHKVEQAERTLQSNWDFAKSAGRKPAPVWAVIDPDGDMVNWSVSKRAAEKVAAAQWDAHTVEKRSPTPEKRPTDAEAKAKALIPAHAVAHLPEPGSLRQPAKDWAELSRMGEAGLADFQKRMGGIAKAMGLRTDQTPETMDETPGGHLFIAENKSEGRATEKVNTDYEGDWSQLRDMVRGSIAVDTLDELQQAIDNLAKHGVEFAAKPKNKFAKPTSQGYRDINGLVKLENGMVAELQIHLKDMIRAKNKMHDAYAHAQKIERKNGNTEPNEKWSEQDRAVYAALEKSQKDAYGAAWTRATA